MFSDTDVTKAMTEIVLNLLDENPDAREEACKAMETVLKEAGSFPDEIRDLMNDVLPPEPPRPMSPRLAAELERLKAEDEAREAEKARKAAEGSSDSDSAEVIEEHFDKKSKSFFCLSFSLNLQRRSLQIIKICLQK